VELTSNLEWTQQCKASGVVSLLEPAITSSERPGDQLDHQRVPQQDVGQFAGS